MNATGAIVSGVVGERLCLAEEMRDIDVEHGHRDQQDGQERRGSGDSGDTLRDRRERGPAPTAELRVTVVGGEPAASLRSAEAIPGGAAAGSASSSPGGGVVWPEKAPSTPSRRPARAGPTPLTHGGPAPPQHAINGGSPLRAARSSGGSQTELVAMGGGRVSSTSPPLLLGPSAAEATPASSPTTMAPRSVADAAGMVPPRTPVSARWSSQQSGVFASPPSPGRATSPRAAGTATAMLAGVAALLTPATKTTRQRTGGSSSAKD